MPSRRVIFYTDCYVFGGCEKPIFEIASSPEFLRKYDYRLAYRTSSEYVEGMQSNFPDIPKAKLRAMKFSDIHNWHLDIEKRISERYSQYIAKKFASVLFRILKPFIFLYEIVVLRFLFLREKADIVHINSGGYPGALSSRAAVLAARLAGIDHVVLSVHNMARKSCGIFDAIIDQFVRQSVSFVVAVSEASGSTLRVNRGFDKGRIVNIYNGIEDVEIAKIDPAERWISMIARFDERKGHGIAVQAMKELIAGHPEFSDAKMIFMGDGPLLDRIKGLAQNEGVGKNSIFLGHRSDRLNYVASSIFLVNPSLEYESLPYSIMEAMALGIPAIGADVGGIPEEIEDGVTGIVVPPGDAAALAQAMSYLLSNTDKCRRMGVAARKRFCERFTLDKMLGSYISLYDKML